MNADILDLILVLACVAFAISGYRQGFLIGVLSFVGFLGGGVLGAKYSPALHSALGVSWNPAVFGLIVVFVAASVGQLLATAAATAVRSRITWHPARLVDAAGGSVVSVVSVLLVAWLVGTAVAHSQLGVVSRQVRHSAILAGIDDVMPDAARNWFSAFRRLLDRNGFPQVFGAIGPERIVPVAPPDPAVLRNPAVRTAAPSIVKIVGVARSCSRQLEGSGFVFATGGGGAWVMTNAHVVAGVSDPTVQLYDGSRSFPSTVVLYDPETDVAVLRVDRLTSPALRFAGQASRGDSAIVVGFPQNGPFDVEPARIRDVQEARGPDIYQRQQVTRQIYSLYAEVRPGNSGGPLLSPQGTVYGVVFAAAVDNDQTGYALTAAEVSADAKAGAGRTAAVGTGSCD